LPPSLHFSSPNPLIDFHNSPFYVNHRLTVGSAIGDGAGPE
jgi:acyl transferase domain-containing protein